MFDLELALALPRQAGIQFELSTLTALEAL